MVKEKQNRTYDQDGFRRRAACLCVHDPLESEILLVTSSRATDHWIVPGGGVEPNEDPSGAAIRETEEEAGVKGTIKRCLGDFEVRGENMERKHRTSVFVLEVSEELDEWEDSKCRKRRWFPVQEALKLLSIYKPVQCTYVNFLIQSSTTSHHLSSESFHKSSLPILSQIESSIKSPFDSSTSSHYLRVNHYPNNNASNTNADYHTFICTRNVYSTDSETTEDGINLVDTSNHFANDDVNRGTNSSQKPEPIIRNTDCNTSSTAEIFLPGSSVKS